MRSNYLLLRQMLKRFVKQQNNTTFLVLKTQLLFKKMLILVCYGLDGVLQKDIFKS